MKTRIIIFLSLFSVLVANAQTDSLTIYNVVKSADVTATPQISRKQYNIRYAHHSFCVALPVAAAGFALMPADKYIADGVQKKLPGFEAKFDDYLQYAPWAAHLAMGACGVKGVSKNRYQVLTADALAAVMMAATVKGLKICVNRTRPNGEEESFPSGHTAKAFMGATLLAHEYGHRSVWIPIAGYTVATATGVMRVLNNRHYVSDVLVGAAVGILTAELAYWATDAIFNDWKITKSHRRMSSEYIIKNY
jgi:hypothetical protein